MARSSVEMKRKKVLLFSVAVVSLSVAIAWLASGAARSSDASGAPPRTEQGPDRLIGPRVSDRTVRRTDGGSLSVLKDPKLSSQLVLLAEAAARAPAARPPPPPPTPPPPFPPHPPP